MAEEISDDRFKSEMMRMMNTVILKLGDHDQRFESIDQRFDTLEEKLTGIPKKLSLLKKT